MRKQIIAGISAIVFIFSVGIHTTYAEEESRRSFMAFPAAFYTTDTGFGGGFAAVKSYNPERARLSNVQLAVIYTAKKQTSIGFRWDHYLPNNRDRVFVELGYLKFPTDYFGLGNNTSNDDPGKFTPEYFEGKVTLERRMINSLRLKTILLFRNQSLIKEKPENILALSGAKWPEGRFDTGIAFAVAWDSRDNLFATKTGRFIQLEYRGNLYHNEGGSFDRLTFDARSFYNPVGSIVFASMMMFERCTGDVPFYLLSELGGQDRIRGYENERFRDNNLLLFQQDMRFMIWGPIGGAVFASSGRVANETGDLFSGMYHTSVGAGLRFVFNKEDNLVLRGDFARGSDSTGVYLTFSEAF